MVNVSITIQNFETNLFRIVVTKRSFKWRLFIYLFIYLVLENIHALFVECILYLTSICHFAHFILNFLDFHYECRC
jgi:hypothetical protein